MICLITSGRIRKGERAREAQRFSTGASKHGELVLPVLLTGGYLRRVLVTAGRLAVSPWYCDRRRRRSVVAYEIRGALGINGTSVSAGLPAPGAASPGNPGTPDSGKRFPASTAWSKWRLGAA